MNANGENLPALVGGTSHVSAVPVEALNSLESEQEAHRSGLNVNDLLYILFKHKWKIILCSVLGIFAAAAVYFLVPPLYESEAKLLVRYVVDKSAIDKIDGQIKTPSSQSDTLIGSEMQILTSLDVAIQVAQAIGAEQLLPATGDKANTDDLARGILRDLVVTAPKGGNIIVASYRSKNRMVVTPVLEELVKRYFDKHLEVHRSVGTFNFVTQQADQVRVELNQTDEKLKQLKAKAGVVSLAEETSALAAELAKTQGDLDVADAEYAAQRAHVKELEKSLATGDTKPSDNPIQQPRGDVVQEYQALVGRLTQLRQIETDLVSRYTPQSRLVKVKRAQIDDLEKQRRELERKFPGLVAVIPAVGTAEVARPDLLSERAALRALEAKMITLKSRLSTLRERAKTLSELGPEIVQLERKKEVDEANYKYFQASLEKARIDETLDPSRIPNISIVQKPSSAQLATREVKKLVLGLAGGGLAVGIAIALLIELVLDRTVKRSLELETRLRIPLLLSIPLLPGGGNRLRLHGAGYDSDTALRESASSNGIAEDSGQLLRPFCEAIRDRLGLFFELNRKTHKPKLVAVTGLSKMAGASTLAAGLAASLSEASEGKVLLVDKPVAPKRFYDMLLEFKASDFNYVVFDMPSLGGTSATVPLAGFMDKVLLVVEAEKSNRDAVKRAYAQLAAKADVSVIFNKSRSYGPKWLEGEV